MPTPDTHSTLSVGAQSPRSAPPPVLDGLTAAPNTSPRRSAFYLYIFNFDGVLANTARLYLDVCHHALVACGHDRQVPSVEDLVRCERFDGAGLADTFALSDANRRFFIKHVDGALARAALACDLFPGIALALRTLSSTAYTAVVSRSTPEFIATALRANGVPHAVNRTLGIDCGNPVDCIRQVLSELQIAPARAVYCGDCVHDLHVARLAGVNAAACAWGWQGSLLQASPPQAQLVFNRPAHMLTSLASPHQAQPDIVL